MFFQKIVEMAEKRPLVFFKYYISRSILNSIIIKRQLKEENLKAVILKADLLVFH